MFDPFASPEATVIRVMDDEGQIVHEDRKPPLEDQEVLDGYKRMLFARTADAMAVSYQRQGRMYTYPPNLGQEAISGAFGRVMRKEDWLVPAFRELGAWIQKGARMRDIFLLWMGVEEGNRMSDAPRMLPPAIPIASQLLHAVGIGKAMRYRKEESVVFAFVGDGGTSTGDFHEALNFAAVWDAPVVFIIQNNQYAISLPLRMQTRAKTLASKAEGFGLLGLQVDGNDFFALSTVALAARKHALEKGPVLIEAITYRRGAHTTSDDPSKYRSPEEETAWEVKDPLRRLRLYLEAKGLWDEKEERALLDAYKKEIDQEFLLAEAHHACRPEDVFKHAYKEMPVDLKYQQAEFEKYLNWKEHYPWPL